MWGFAGMLLGEWPGIRSPRHLGQLEGVVGPSELHRSRQKVDQEVM